MTAFRDLSHVPYWTLKIWRDYAEDEADRGVDDSFHNRLWMAELNAEIARRCEQTHGQQLPDGYDIYGSPAWLEWWRQWTPGEPVPPQNPMGHSSRCRGTSRHRLRPGAINAA